MTTKRFPRFVQSWNRQDGAYIFDRQIPTKYNSIWVCMDIMNELHDENEQLKSSDTITDLETKIMTLKTIINQLRTDNTKMKKKLNTTMKENEQLKEALFFYISVAITETSSHINEDLEQECNQLLNCSYKEALKKYDTSKYE